MAAYNGSRYIHEQIASILPQLEQRDELIVVDDDSEDNTTALIESFADSRVRLVRNEHNFGVTRSFERALQLASGDIIFLSDQDDVWRADKVRTILLAFDSDPRLTLVISGVEVTDLAGNCVFLPVRGRVPFRGGVLRTLVKNSYQGCAMAFRKAVAEASLPFPKDLPMHDSWIGLVNAIIGKAAYLDEPLLFYRRHGSNATTHKHGPATRMLAQRWKLARELVCRAGRLLRARRELKKKLSSGVAVPASGY
jgi:glycosyltransferase involved in cell wall biosynthesis